MIGEFGDYNNFFNDVLEPLFYEALASERPDDYYSRFNCKIPFLNGGLFEALHDYNWREVDILLPNNLFQQIFETFDLYNFTVREDEPLEKEVAVDPEMLGKVFENLLPENLRKGKGTYYTPRPIVHYMCQESLINYLVGESEGIIPKEDIEELVRRGESAVENDAVSIQKRLENENYKGDYKPIIGDSIRNNAQLLDDKLAGIKVCDPAVGSGAFPVGMMHEVVKARNVLTNYLPDKTGRDTYSLKRHCIQESLYGVDIDPGAIDIAKLRLWLSLIVDEEDYKRINPLPNLDCKIMQGNSLIEDFHGISLDLGKNDNGDLLGKDPELEGLIKDLHEKQNAFFNATHPGEKRRLKDAVEEAIIAVFRYRLKQEQKPYYDSLKSIERTALSLSENTRDQYIREETAKLNKRFDFDPEAVEHELREMTHGNKVRSFFPWRLYFADVFRNKGGFDVVIANPPYLFLSGKGSPVRKLVKDGKIREAEDLKQLHDSYARRFPRSSLGCRDLYKWFIELAFQLVKAYGKVSYITPNTYIVLKKYADVRRILLIQNTTEVLVDLGFGIFEIPIVPSAVFLASRIPTADSSVPYCDLKIIDRSDLRNHTLSNLVTDNVVNVPVKEAEILLYKHPLAEKIYAKFDTTLNEYASISEGEHGMFVEPERALTVPNSDTVPAVYDALLKRFTPATVVHIPKRNCPNYNRNLHSGERCFIRKTGDRILATLPSQFDLAVAHQNIYVVHPKTALLNVYALLGLLNSSLLSFLYQNGIYGQKGRTLAQFRIYALYLLPTPAIDRATVDTLSKTVMKILDVKRHNPTADTTALEQEIDRLVYKLYDLTDEEIKIVEEAKSKR